MQLSHEAMRRLQGRASQAEARAAELEVQLVSRRRALRSLGEQLAALHRALPDLRETERREGRAEALATYHDLHDLIWRQQLQLGQERAERAALERHLEVLTAGVEQAQGELAEQHQLTWAATARAAAELAALRQQLAATAERHQVELDEVDPRNLRARLERERAERRAAELRVDRLRQQQLAEGSKSRREREWEAPRLVVVPRSAVEG